MLIPIVLSSLCAVAPEPDLPPGLRETLAAKPSPYIVKAHDVGAPTNFDADFSWHSLAKEKDPRFRLPHAGKLGLVTPTTDYIWTSIPAIMVVEIVLGVRPTAKGVEILPALPEGWPGASVGRLLVRGKRLSVSVRRSPDARETSAKVDGAARPAFRGRGVFLPWPELRESAAIEIVQPPRLPDAPPSGTMDGTMRSED